MKIIAMSLGLSLCAGWSCARPQHELKQKKVASGSVHVVGLYQASPDHFRLVGSVDDMDWPRLCKALAELSNRDAPNAGKRVWELLPQSAKDVAADKEKLKRIGELVENRRSGKNPPGFLDAIKAIAALEDGLAEALRSTEFYQEKAFGNVKLDHEGADLLKKRARLSTLELWVLNRRLLEASFPDAVKKSKFSLDKSTVSVTVVATKDPITLVLCSNESVRWIIKEEKGAKLENVIVGGYHVQHVSGTKAPITYHVYEPAKSGTRPDFFYAYKKDNVNYAKMADAVKRLTGKDIATFQGNYTFDGKTPLIVGAKE
jgi:hypothetical protein